MKNWQKYADLLPYGDWHMHTTYTDGRDTVDAMCVQAVRNGLRLLVFTEHVRRQLDYDYDHLLEDIERARRKYPLTLLAGCEAKILDRDGTLDVSEDVLARCEIVLAVVHSFPYEDTASWAEAVGNALRHPRVDIWGHPTHFLYRRGLTPSAEEIRILGEVCIEAEVLVERSLAYGLPDERFVSLAGNVTYVESSDAHSARDLRCLPIGPGSSAP